MKIPYFCCIGAELKRYAKDFDFMNQVYLYKVPTDDSIEEVLAEDYFKAISDSVLQDDLVYIYEASSETLHSCRFDKQNGHITAVPLASDETLTGAVTTIIHDNLTKNRAVISNNDGKIAVSEVTTTELGYLSGATSNIQDQLNNKATKDLSNLTSTGKNIGNWSSNVTNCITEIPQDIKLELNNGTLTLKAGSKVYVPNGAGNFDVRTTANDMSATFSTNGTYLVGFSFSFGNITAYLSTVSGGTEPTTLTNGLTWYDTTNNVIKRAWAGSWQNSLFSLPICIVTVSGGQITSIDQVFNGIGYIGSTVFALPGVKGLIPNGRNADGSLNNILTTPATTVHTNTAVSGNTGRKTMTITSSGVIDRPGGLEYNERENINYNFNSRSLQCACGHFTVGNDYKITNFVVKTAFHAVDYNDTEYIAHQAMPSGKKIDLTASLTDGYVFNAPADGYVYLGKYSTASGQRIRLNNTTIGSAVSCWSSGAQNLECIIAVSKGQNVKAVYSADGGTNGFSFMYSNGAK